MKVVVTNGYVTVGSILHAAGVELDLPDGTAKNLLMEGVISLPDMIMHAQAQDEENTGAQQQDGEDAGAEDTDLAPAELPSVDPAAAAKKTRGKKA
jgi:hypothetical protein